MTEVHYVDSESKRLKALRRKTLVESLAAMRSDDENVDVTLVCGNKEFHAHRLVLEASSPYFLKMFRSGMKETNFGKVVFESMAPETLEAILNYIYLGELDDIDTVQQAASLLSASLMMELNDLTQFCFEVLASIVSVLNYVKIWEIAAVHDSTELKTKLMEFIFANFKEFEASDIFLNMRMEQLKEFLLCVASQQACLDDVLQGILKWLSHDLVHRIKFAQELFACIKPKSLSHQCVKELLLDRILMASSPEIANRMNELAVAMFVLHNGNRTEGTITFVVTKLKVGDNLRSSPVMIQNLPWNIMVMYKSNNNRKAIGFFVQCNVDSAEEDWCCNAKIEYILLSNSENVEPKIRHAEHSFCDEELDWGFSTYIDKVLQPSLHSEVLKGTCIFKAKITASPPALRS